MELNVYLQIFWRRKGLFAAVAGAFVVVALALCFLPRKTYKARADFRVIMTALEPNFIYGVSSQYGRIEYGDGRFEYLVNTVMEMLKCAEVVIPVIRDLDLRDSDGATLKPDDFADLNVFKRLLSPKAMAVDNVTDAEVFQVTGYSTDPQQAAAIANKTIENFQRLCYRRYRSAGEIARTTMEKRFAVVEARIKSIEDERLKKRVADFNIDLDSSEQSQQVTQYLSRYMSLETDLSTTERNHEATLASQKVIEEIKKQLPELRSSTESIERNPLLQSYESQLLTYTIEYLQRRIELTENHPDVKRSLAAIDRTREEWKALAKEIFSSSGMSRNTDFDTLATTLINNDIDLKTYDLRRRLVVSELDKHRRRLLEVPRVQTEWSRPSRELTALRSEWSGLYTSIESMKVALTVDFSNVNVLRWAAINPNDPKDGLYFPRKKIVLALGLFFGVFVGLMLVYAVDAVDNRIQTPSQLEPHSDAPILGVLPNFYLSSLRPLRPGAAALNAFHNLRVRLRTATSPAPAVVAVTGPAQGEGKSTVAALLAVASARSGAPTLLIDANLRHPCVASWFGVAPAEAAEAFASADAFAAAIRPSPEKGLDVAAFRRAAEPPVGLFERTDWNPILDALRRRYPFIVIDLPGLDVGLESALVAGRADATLVVVRAGRCTPQRLRRIIQALRGAGARIAGWLMNRTT